MPPRRNKPKMQLLETTFHAICREGDFRSDPQPTENLANIEAAKHQRQPGCDEHIIDIVRTKKASRVFTAE